jgi:hypothetical protein
MKEERTALLAEFNALVEQLVVQTKEFNELDGGDLKGSIHNNITYTVSFLYDTLRELLVHINDAK